MAFAQLTFRESLRGIEACLGAVPDRLYHMGIRGTVTRSTFADANERRDWRIYADYAQVLISEARRLYAGESLALELEQTVYCLDSSTIEFCLGLFPWAVYQKDAAGVKLHTLLDLRGNLPAYIRITPGSPSVAHAAGVWFVTLRRRCNWDRIWDRSCGRAGYFHPWSPVGSSGTSVIHNNLPHSHESDR